MSETTRPVENLSWYQWVPEDLPRTATAMAPLVEMAHYNAELAGWVVLKDRTTFRWPERNVWVEEEAETHPGMVPLVFDMQGYTP